MLFGFFSQLADRHQQLNTFMEIREQSAANLRDDFESFLHAKTRKHKPSRLQTTFVVDAVADKLAISSTSSEIKRSFECIVNHKMQTLQKKLASCGFVSTVNGIKACL